VDLAVAEICLGPNLGGLELYALECMTRYCSREQTGVAIVAKGSRLESQLQSLNVRFISIPAPNRKWSLQTARRIARIATSHKIKVMHLHYNRDIPIGAIAKALLRNRVRLVFTRQIVMPQSKKDLIHRLIYRQYNHIIAIAKWLQLDLQKKLPLPKSRIHLLYYGVPVQYHAPETLVDFRLSLPGTATYKTAMFSKVMHQKGQHTLLEAAALLKEENILIDIHLFGDTIESDYRNYLQDLMEQHQLQDQVFFHGFQDQASSYIPAFDCVVMPSMGETLGIVVIEAQKLMVPVIGADSGGIPEVIEDGKTGWLFETDNPSSLAEKIKQSMSNEQRRSAVCRQAKIAAEERFDQAAHFEKLSAIFKS